MASLTHVVGSVASRRKEDGQKYRNWFRSDRMSENGGKWFFCTREGTIEGPFDSQMDARSGLDVYINTVNLGLSPPINDLTLET